ncbi:MAG: PilW family protein [Steroidobacteraceae bacterium]
MNAASNRPAAAQLAQRGFTLVELMIALLMAVLLMFALVEMVQGMRNAYNAQSGMSQLQDDQRMAMTFLSNAIQSAGYYTLAASPGNSAAVSLPVLSPFATAGQSVYGTGTWASAQDTITVRYMTAGADGITNCAGVQSAVAATFVNTFSIDAYGDLNCSVATIVGATTTTTTTQLISGSTVAGKLVRGVVGMQIYYGVQTIAANATSVDTYLDGPTVNTGSYWMIAAPAGTVNNVISVKVTLTFLNPQYGQPGQTNQNIAFTRVINVMNKTGAST